MPSAVVTPLYKGRVSAYNALPRRRADVIFAGDSLSDFCEWNELLERSVLNRGIMGDTVEGLQSRIDEILSHHPRQLFLMIGVNNFLNGASLDDTLSHYGVLVKKIRTASPDTKLFLQSVLPIDNTLWKSPMPQLETKIVKMNVALKRMADGKGVVFIDIYPLLAGRNQRLDRRYTSDGVHLNGAGYARWHKELQPFFSATSASNKT